MERAVIEEHLALAERHVAQGEGHIRQQRELIVRLEREGQESAEARRLLNTFEELQGLHVADRNRLQAELDGAS